MGKGTDVVLPPPVVGTLRDSPEDVPGLTKAQDDARSKALEIYQDKGLPFLEQLLDSKKSSDRMKLDAVKELRAAAVPPPQPVIGDVDVTIIVDL